MSLTIATNALVPDQSRDKRPRFSKTLFDSQLLMTIKGNYSCPLPSGSIKPKHLQDPYTPEESNKNNSKPANRKASTHIHLAPGFSRVPALPTPCLPCCCRRLARALAPLRFSHTSLYYTVHTHVRTHVQTPRCMHNTFSHAAAASQPRGKVLPAGRRRAALSYSPSRSPHYSVPLWSWRHT